MNMFAHNPGRAGENGISERMTDPKQQIIDFVSGFSIETTPGSALKIPDYREHLRPGTRVAVTSERSELERADRVVWPGQGAIGTCLRALDSLGLREVFEKLLVVVPYLIIFKKAFFIVRPWRHQVISELNTHQLQ